MLPCLTIRASLLLFMSGLAAAAGIGRPVYSIALTASFTREFLVPPILSATTRFLRVRRSHGEIVESQHSAATIVCRVVSQ